MNTRRQLREWNDTGMGGLEEQKVKVKFNKEDWAMAAVVLAMLMMAMCAGTPVCAARCGTVMEKQWKLTRVGTEFKVGGTCFRYAGPGSPENFLSPNGPFVGNATLRAQQFAYLRSTGCNVLYISLFGGDDRSVTPFVGGNWVNGVDYAKLDQWCGVFEQANAYGIVCHLFLHERENENEIEGGQLGTVHKEYYRAVVERVRDLPLVMLNVGEENNYSTTLFRKHAVELRRLDPFHPIGVHTNPNALPSSGVMNTVELDFVSLQASLSNGVSLVGQVRNAGKAATFDEQTSGYDGVGDVAGIKNGFRAALNAGASGVSCYGGSPETGDGESDCGAGSVDAYDDLDVCGDFGRTDELMKALGKLRIEFDCGYVNAVVGLKWGEYE